MRHEPIARGVVEGLCLDGVPDEVILFGPDGPQQDRHEGSTRLLSGHDGEYVETFGLPRGSEVFNWRTWTAVSREEVYEIEQDIGYLIPQGILLENLIIRGVPKLSKLTPCSGLVFLARDTKATRLVLSVWGENEPCGTVGKRLADHHGVSSLTREFREKAMGKRGVMGVVLSVGMVHVGDEVQVYSPVHR